MRIGKKSSKKLMIILIVIVIIAAFAFIYIDSNLTGTLFTLAEGRFKYLGAKAMNDAVLEILDESGYDDLVNILQDETGKVTMMQADTIKMNHLAAKTALRAQEKINEIGIQGIEIPVGTLTGVKLFSNIGPKVNVNVLPAGSVKSEFLSQFEAAGINQTRHQIILQLTANVNMVVSGRTQSVSVDVGVPVSESIIVGDVPDSFVDINRQNDLLNLIPSGE